MPKVSVKSVEHKGIPFRTRTDREVGRAITAEAIRTRRGTGHVIATLLRYWYEDVYLPDQKAQEKS